MIIRTVTEKDAHELLEIYRPYVEDTAITFEYDVPSVEEFAERIRRISANYPYIATVRKRQNSRLRLCRRFQKQSRL